LLAPWDNAQAVGKIPRNYEESSVTVDEQLYLLAATSGPGEPRRYAKESHQKYRTIAPCGRLLRAYGPRNDGRGFAPRDDYMT